MIVITLILLYSDNYVMFTYRLTSEGRCFCYPATRAGHNKSLHRESSSMHHGNGPRADVPAVRIRDLDSHPTGQQRNEPRRRIREDGKQGEMRTRYSGVQWKVLTRCVSVFRVEYCA